MAKDMHGNLPQHWVVLLKPHYSYLKHWGLTEQLLCEFTRGRWLSPCTATVWYADLLVLSCCAILNLRCQWLKVSVRWLFAAQHWCDTVVSPTVIEKVPKELGASPTVIKKVPKDRGALWHVMSSLIWRKIVFVFLCLSLHPFWLLIFYYFCPFVVFLPLDPLSFLVLLIFSIFDFLNLVLVILLPFVCCSSPPSYMEGCLAVGIMMRLVMLPRQHGACHT